MNKSDYAREYYQQHADKLKAYGREYRKAHPEQAKNWRAQNVEHIAQYKRDYDQNNLEINRNWRTANAEKIRKYKHDWMQSNRGLRRATENKRRAQKLQATPKWLSKEQLETMKQFYINCPKGYVVDHVHPLQGNGFRGLHVPWNLQYLLVKKNIAKGNRLEEI